MDQTESLKYLKEQHPEAISKRLKATSGVVKVPIQLLTDKRIRHPPSIILYGMLVGMTNKYSRIFVSNGKLAQLLNVKSVNSITNYLKELMAGGFISLSYAHTGLKTARQIKINCIPKPGNYVGIPLEAIKDNTITPLQALIIGCVYSWMWKYKRIYIFINANDVAKALNKPTKTIKNNMTALTKAGYLERLEANQLTVKLQHCTIEQVLDYDLINRQ